MPAFPESFPPFPPLGLKWVHLQIKIICSTQAQVLILVLFQDVPTGFANVNPEENQIVDEEEIIQSQEENGQQAFAMS